MEETYITGLATDSYSFTDENGANHHKEVSLFVFKVDTKCELRASEKEMVEAAMWFNFKEARKVLKYNKDELVRARELFYSHVL